MTIYIYAIKRENPSTSSKRDENDVRYIRFFDILEDAQQHIEQIHDNITSRSSQNKGVLVKQPYGDYVKELYHIENYHPNNLIYSKQDSEGEHIASLTIEHITLANAINIIHHARDSGEDRDYIFFKIHGTYLGNGALHKLEE